MSIDLKKIPNLADRLQYIRRVKGLTQVDLAELAGTTQQAIQQAEKGKARNPRYLNKLALALDIPPEWLAMNMLPEKKQVRGVKEKDLELIDMFKSMPLKDQKLMTELIKSRAKNKK